MSEKLTRLAERRAAIVAKAARQRETLAEATRVWRRPLSWVDRGASLLGHITRHPLLMAGSLATVVALRPYFLIRWGQRAWVAWRLAQGVRKRLSR
jgi:hypothetical protein